MAAPRELSVPPYETVRLDETDSPELRRLCLNCTAFFELVEGHPASEATAADILGPLDREHATGVKHVWGIRGDPWRAEALPPLSNSDAAGDERANPKAEAWPPHSTSRRLIAVAELLEGYPGASEWYIGLLLVDPPHRNNRLGARFSAAIVDWIADRGGSTVRLVVQRQNPGARAFWERQGFEIEREAQQNQNLVWVLVRRL